MTQVLASDLAALRSRFVGRLINPGDGGYDEARRVWNAAIDRRPAVIARCADAADVSAALEFGRAQGLEITVRGGAHNASGAAVGDGCLMLDLSRMRRVRVDSVARRAWAGGGATNGDLDAAAQAHGLAAVTGSVSTTGLGGLTLGGGMSPRLTRAHGLACDNVCSAEVVLADGQIVRAAPDEHPDLFWAIRGGGGNFGVVTEFQLRLHPVKPLVDFALLFWPLERGGEVLRLARDVLPTLSRNVSVMIAGVNAPPAPFVPERHHFQPGYALEITGFGSEQEHAEVVSRFRRELAPLFEMVMPMPYVQVQKLMDEAAAWGFRVYDKGAQVAELSDAVIEVVTEHVPRKKSPSSVVFVYQLDGAYSEVGDDDTAFGSGRSPRYQCFMLDMASTEEAWVADRAWVRSFWAALQPHALGRGSYVNDSSELPDEWVRASYGPKYARLAQIKAKYDPDNVFRHNANIQPATR
jgi:FAD binding domain/Berberine and berberine like